MSWGLPVAICLLVVVSGNVAASATHLPATSPTSTVAPPSKVVPILLAPPATPIPSNLSVGGLTGILAPQFYGVDVNNEAHLLRGETNAINATPAHVLVFPGAIAGEDYDPLTNTHYNGYGGHKTALTSEAQFVQLCRAIHCTAILQLPAEIDNTSIAEAIVNYTEVNLSFRPAYWMIGNEPELWYEWQVPWKDWGSSYGGGPTPTQFGDEVLQYVHAIRQVDPVTPIFGLPASGCTCGYYTFPQWISAVLNVTGDQIQVVAFHEYPAGWLGTGDGSLFDFYGTLQSAANIPIRVAAARAAVQESCPKCNVSVFVSELGSALSWSAYGQYAQGFSGDLSIAAQMTQAMDVNLTNIDLFAAELGTTNSWFNYTGYARPDYGLYTQILTHLGTNVYPVNFTGFGGTMYGVDTTAPNDGNRQDLLVVNVNLTHSVKFTPRFADYSGAAPVEAYYWNGSIHDTTSNYTTWVEPYTPNPVVQLDSGGLPTSYVLPPQSMALFETYPDGASFVRIVPTGVPAGIPWYTTVGSTQYTTMGNNISLLMPSGAYNISGAPIPLPLGGREFTPVERLAPFVASPMRVSGAYTNVTENFVTQWMVNVTTSPVADGNVSASPGWANASEPLTLHVNGEAPGYAFTNWDGWGPGSAYGANRTITIVPTGRVIETAHFALGDPTTFTEQGLAPGTPWSVTVHQFTTTSKASTLTIYQPPGTYGYSVSPVSGYRILPENGSFVVVGWSVRITFIPISPPPPTFPVTFSTSGLPAGTSVSITIRGSSLSAGATNPLFSLINGTYAYELGYVPGYHAVVPQKTFDVIGRAVGILIPFVPTVYNAIWEAQGVRTGVNWSVDLNGSVIPASTAWITVPLRNGTYPYTISFASNYSSSLRSGTLVVQGAAPQVFLSFWLPMYAAGVQATGPGASDPWSIRLGNLTLPSTSAGSGFLLPNGTYSFDVHPPAGYYADPSHGNLTVSGPVPMLVISFHPTSLKPSAALVAALTSGAFVVSAWLALSVVAGFLIVRAVRRRR